MPPCLPGAQEQAGDGHPEARAHVRAAAAVPAGDGRGAAPRRAGSRRGPGGRGGSGHPEELPPQAGGTTGACAAPSPVTPLDGSFLQSRNVFLCSPSENLIFHVVTSEIATGETVLKEHQNTLGDLISW